MDGGYPRPRNRSGAGQPMGRPGEDGRRGAVAPLMSPPQSSMGGMSRAERFEDEKRRITDSCFAKLDDAGQLSESYITHIRVQEDAAYPQTAPPPSSPPSNKKPRVIIIAVRSSGRVRIHKARENSNGTFSIGKTWNMEEVTAVESFTSAVPASEEERRQQEWAGDVGFIVTIGKPYYWEAGTPKEKDFFIASLVKIYRKYTQGKIPQLVGFSPQETDHILGPPNRQSAGDEQRPPSLQSGVRSRGPSQAGPSTGSNGNVTHPTSLLPKSGLPSSPRNLPGAFPAPSSARQSDYSDPIQSREFGRPPRPRPSPDYGMRQDQARDPGRQPGDPSASASMPRLTPQSSISEAVPQRSVSPGASSTTSSKGGPVSLPQSPRQPRQPPDYQPPYSRQDDQMSKESSNLASSTFDRWKPNGLGAAETRDSSPRALRPSTAQSNDSSMTSRSDDIGPDRGRNMPSDRRRPPFMTAKSGSTSRSAAESGDDFSTPMGSPGLRADRRHPSLPRPDAGMKSPPFDNRPGGFHPSPPPFESDRSEPAESSRQPKNTLMQSRTDPNISGTGPAVSPPMVSPTTQAEKDQEEEVHRPGLGPMIKNKLNKDPANAFRKAANAYSAFQPRAGGARARLFGNEPKPSDEPNGITGVVPAPGLRRVMSDESTRSELSDDSSKRKEDVAPTVSHGAPGVTISRATTVTEGTSTPVETNERLQPEKYAETAAAESKSPKTPEPEPEPPQQKRRTAQQLKYLTDIGVDPSLLEGRGLEFESILDDFGWGNWTGEAKKVDAFETEVRRELNRVQAGSWLSQLEQGDERVRAVDRMLDKAIAECDELDGLLTLYSVELSSLNDDIAYIEAQSQGLQVQTANQKLLQTELQGLLETISVDPRQLEPLRRASMGSLDGLEAIESALLLLYKALITIDPSLRKTVDLKDERKDPKAVSESNTNELSSMWAVQERKDRYLTESTIFLERLQQFLDVTFGAALSSTKDALNRRGSAADLSTKLDPSLHDLARSSLWQYSPVILFAKEIDFATWKNLVKLYCQRARPLYQEELRDNTLAWKKLARKPTTEELEVLFTYQEKESDSLSSTARKLTVKRSQTLARTLRSGAEKASPRDKTQAGKMHPFEAFAGALDEVTPLIFTEQNFIIDFFHATSSENIEFSDAVLAAPPENRRGTNLYARKLFEADRGMAKLVVEIMDDVFGHWPTELQNFVEWAVVSDPLQGVGILCAMEQKMVELEDTNQDFINRTLQKVHDRLISLFNRFVEDQVRAIEDTKVKINKRKGVIAFIRTFPHFSASVENMLPAEASPKLSIRSTVDDAYQRINKTMFESLKVIAKDSPAVNAGHGPVGQGAADPEDKEALNYHILLIENMNHYVEEVEDHGDAVLREWKENAAQEMNEHLGLYVGAVIRRPIGKLLDFLESTEALTASNDGPPTAISTHSSHARSVFKKLLAAYDAKELRRGVDALKKRVDKHFGDADDPTLSRNLVLKVLKECENKYLEVYDRTKKVADEVYEGSVELEWKREDVGAVFRR